VLALVPPLFGLLGLGQLYGFRRVERGLFFLAVGLAIYVPMIGIFMLMLKSGILSAILLFVLDGVLLLAYLAVALAAFMDAAFGASLRFGIRR
jgi:hypothetical protein